MSHYSAETLWERKDADFLDNRYSRRHLLRFDGGLEVPGSSSPSVVPVPMAAVFLLQSPIGFDAPDEQAVALLIFLLVPEAATQKHLEILSEIAELLSDSTLREQLKTSTDAAALHHLIASWHSVHEVSS